MKWFSLASASCLLVSDLATPPGILNLDLLCDSLTNSPQLTAAIFGLLAAWGLDDQVSASRGVIKG
jgi:hypothetical protein